MRLGDDVRIIRRRANGSAYLSCPRCDAELDTEAGEWVAAFPDRAIHGYRISQLFSAKIDPGEILDEYETTRFPDRFYNLKIGIAWADTANRVDVAAVLACCGDEGMLERAADTVSCTMGVDTGKDLHVVVSHKIAGEPGRRQVVYTGPLPLLPSIGLQPPTAPPHAGPIHAAPPPTAHSGARQVPHERARPERISVRLDAGSQGWLVLREWADPVWRVTVDGERRTWAIADGMFIGVPLGAGPHPTELLYRPVGWTASLVLAARGLAYAAACVVGSMRTP